jgi:hypothetical protein
LTRLIIGPTISSFCPLNTPLSEYLTNESLAYEITNVGLILGTPDNTNPVALALQFYIFVTNSYYKLLFFRIKLLISMVSLTWVKIYTYEFLIDVIKLPS